THCELSALAQKSHVKKTLAKSSILSINYAVEAAANVCLPSIEIMQKLKLTGSLLLINFTITFRLSFTESNWKTLIRIVSDKGKWAKPE
ncbi:hypothetical protein R0J91_15465, partial [Micrococcus sp. SIMBA_131]